MKRLEDTELYGKIDLGKTASKDGAQLGFPDIWESDEEIRQFANYSKDAKPAPDNNPFWENGANPLSSKGN